MRLGADTLLTASLRNASPSFLAFKVFPSALGCPALSNPVSAYHLHYVVALQFGLFIEAEWILVGSFETMRGAGQAVIAGEAWGLVCSQVKTTATERYRVRPNLGVGELARCTIACFLLNLHLQLFLHLV